MALYDTVQYLCRKNNISIAQLEKRLDFGNGTIGRWNKASPSLEKVIKVAKFFEISLESLTGETIRNENALVLTPTERDLICKWRSADKRDKEIVNFILSRYGTHLEEHELSEDINDRINS